MKVHILLNLPSAFTTEGMKILGALSADISLRLMESIRSVRNLTNP